MEKFKVLFIYPNLTLVSTLPNNLALLAGCIKEKGYGFKIFDTTLYQNMEVTNDDLRVRRMQVRPFNIKERGVEVKKTNMYDDFKKLVNNYKPNLIAATVLDDTVEMALSLVNILSPEDKKIPVIFGGVHVFFNKEKLIKNENVDILCIGEGEKAIIELCCALKNNLPVDSIKNLWIKKKDGQLIKNQLSPPIDINSLPFEDFSIFEKKRLYRPMQGKILSTVPINFDRGCPYQCSFCDAPSINKMFQGCGYHNYYRRKSVDRIKKEICHQVNRHNVEYFYFNSETFLTVPFQEVKEFAKMYSKFKIPFWCQTRIETITDEKIKLLKEVNCDRISVGIEHGNEDFRRTILKKFFSNEDVIKAFKILNKYQLKVSVNNMIGFPEETRELIFDTIKKIGSSEGTPMGTSSLKMPQISQDELEGLLRTFVLYVKMPRFYFPKIREAEQLNKQGDETLAELREIFFEKYF